LPRKIDLLRSLRGKGGVSCFRGKRKKKEENEKSGKICFEADAYASVYAENLFICNTLHAGGGYCNFSREKKRGGKKKGEAAVWGSGLRINKEKSERKLDRLIGKGKTIISYLPDGGEKESSVLTIMEERRKERTSEVPTGARVLRIEAKGVVGDHALREPRKFKWREREKEKKEGEGIVFRPIKYQDDVGRSSEGVKDVRMSMKGKRGEGKVRLAG